MTHPLSRYPENTAHDQGPTANRGRRDVHSWHKLNTEPFAAIFVFRPSLHVHSSGRSRNLRRGFRYWCMQSVWAIIIIAYSLDTLFCDYSTVSFTCIKRIFSPEFFFFYPEGDWCKSESPFVHVHTCTHVNVRIMFV